MHPALATAFMPLLRLMEPEEAHDLALSALALGFAGRDWSRQSERLAVSALGLTFRNPIGMAAGFDKDARVFRELVHLGFGFVETGTVTPRPQLGNPQPRLFRLDEDRAVINRMGFNNAGIDAYVRRLRRRRRRGVPVGANVGINKDGADPERDYPALVAAVAPYADYIVINVSSPNTPGLRDLQGEDRLRAILAAIAARLPQRPPLLVKLAPDLPESGFAGLVEVAVAAGIDGLVIGNTTVTRPPGLRSRHARELGGLSGAPLRARALEVLAQTARHAKGRLVLVGVGGIATGADILDRVKAGASLVQLYTAFTYAGPSIVARLRRELLAALDQQGFATLADAIGADLR